MKLLDQINNLDLSPGSNKVLIEFFISQYKAGREEREKTQKQNKEKKQEIKDIKARLTGVQDLINSRNRLDKEIMRFDGMVTENERQMKVQSIKISRINYVFGVLKSIKNSVYNKLGGMLESQDRAFLVGRGILFTILFMLIVSLLFYFVKTDSRLLAIGFVGIVLNTLAFVLINVFNNVEAESIEGLGIDYKSAPGNTYEELIHKLDANQEKYLVNSAWVSALEKEKLNIDSAIGIRLGEDEYKDLVGRIEALENEIEANELALSKVSDNIMTAEEYLSLRRELDILSIELEGEEVSQDDIEKELRNLHIENVGSIVGSFRQLLTLAQAKFQFSVS